jgi:hypothetical protein
VQVGDGELDVVVAALAGTGLCGQQATTVDLLEIAVGELVSALGPLRGFVGEPQVPAGVLLEAVVLDVTVLLLARGLVLAPCVTVVGDELPSLINVLAWPKARLFSFTAMSFLLGAVVLVPTAAD